MIKKAIVGSMALLLLGAFFFGRDLLSYATTSACWVRDSVTEQVPIEFEIERARKMVRDLVPDIRKNMRVITREEVEVERLEKQIEQAEQRLASEKANILRLKTDLQSGDQVFHYASRQYTRDQVKRDLSQRFDRFKTHEATLASLYEIRDARRRSLEAARQKLEGMLAAKRQLEVEVENLEAKLKMLEAAQTTSDYVFDDSRLSRVKSLIGDLHKKLEVAQKMVDAEGHFMGEIPLTDPVPEDIVDEVTGYFDGRDNATKGVAQVASAEEQP